MKNDIKAQDSQQLAFINEQLSGCQVNLVIGDLFIGGNRLYRITYLEVNEQVDIAHWKQTGKQKMTQVVFVHYQKNSGFSLSEFKQSEKIALPEMIQKMNKNNWIKISSDMQGLYSEAIQVINGLRKLDHYRETSLDPTEDSNQLLHLGNKDQLKAVSEDLEQRKNHLAQIQAFVSFEMEKRRAELSKIYTAMSTMLEDFHQKIERIEKVLYTIELYLGIKEDIVQILEGNKADANEPIVFRQQVLFMDEEVGDPMTDGQGLDFKQIRDFDDWLCTHEHYKLVMPEKKGVIVFRVRRNNKEYSRDNPFLNSFLNVENKKTYVLIRNGDCLYRIWGNITIWPRLFPTRTELGELQERWEYLDKQTRYTKEGYELSHRLINLQSYETDESRDTIATVEKGKENVEDILFRYKQYFFMLQGLLDRTEVFYPLPGKINLLNERNHDNGQVRFIYDDEIKLPDTRKEFWPWVKEINEQIGEGTRIFLNMKFGRYLDSKEFKQRWDDRFWNEHQLPALPPSGIYTVEIYSHKVYETITEEIPLSQLSTSQLSYKAQYPEEPITRPKLDERGHQLRQLVVKRYPAIRYNPGGIVRNLWDRWGEDEHERKIRLSWKIYPEDKFIINYDAISLDDLDFYLNSRVNRRHYLKMMPMLMDLRTARLHELCWEKHFVQMLKDEMQRACIQGDIETRIWDCLHWWKTKNKWKRPIREDDAKALRMIKSKLLRSV